RTAADIADRVCDDAGDLRGAAVLSERTCADWNGIPHRTVSVHVAHGILSGNGCADERREPHVWLQHDVFDGDFDGRAGWPDGWRAAGLADAHAYRPPCRGCEARGAAALLRDLRAGHLACVEAEAELCRRAKGTVAIRSLSLSLSARHCAMESRGGRICALRTGLPGTSGAFAAGAYRRGVLGGPDCAGCGHSAGAAVLPAVPPGGRHCIHAGGLRTGVGLFGGSARHASGCDTLCGIHGDPLYGGAGNLQPFDGARARERAKFSVGGEHLHNVTLPGACVCRGRSSLRSLRLSEGPWGNCRGRSIFVRMVLVAAA